MLSFHEIVRKKKMVIVTLINKQKISFETYKTANINDIKSMMP